MMTKYIVKHRNEDWDEYKYWSYTGWQTEKSKASLVTRYAACGLVWDYSRHYGECALAYPVSTVFWHRATVGRRG